MIWTFRGGPGRLGLLYLVAVTVLVVAASTFSVTGAQAQSSANTPTPIPTPSARSGAGNIRVASCGFESYTIYHRGIAIIAIFQLFGRSGDRRCEPDPGLRWLRS